MAGVGIADKLKDNTGKDSFIIKWRSGCRNRVCNIRSLIKHDCEDGVIICDAANRDRFSFPEINVLSRV